MTTIQAIILGIIQGLTEFLPVSSSGHLLLGQYFFGFSQLEKYVGFTLICHLGTLAAVLIIFGQKIISAIREDPKRILLVALGTLPLIPLVIIIKPLKQLFDRPEYVGFSFLITALLLYGGMHWRWKIQSHKRYRDALGIGMFQALAILPGISRSGSTISAARMLGWSPNEAILFSLLLAIPAICGASLIEFIEIFVKGEGGAVLSITPLQYLVGFAASCLSGLVALMILVKVVMQNRLTGFVCYCALLGVVSLIYFNF